jgi:23S rRNA (cytidine2498-2'-O)-methyltransferase
MPPPRAFVWTTHHVSAARWLKAELAQRAPNLGFAFSRPGLTTFKVNPGAGSRALGSPDVALPSSFARAWGLSLGRAANAAEVLAALAGFPRPAAQPLRLHVFERDIDVPVDEQDATIAGTRAIAVEAELRAAALASGVQLLPGVRAEAGELVLDVIVPHAGSPEEPFLVGLHRHGGDHGPFPGGVQHVPPPPDAPSRAWCKIEEALRWAELSPVPGETAVELGSAPGGATLAMLRRGLNVYGVDPGEMHALTHAFTRASGSKQGAPANRFVHLHMPAAEVPKHLLPKRYEWLLNDINLAPMAALRYVERFVALAHGGLKGAVITIKINDDGVFEALPRLLERIRKLGAPRMRVTQLPSHRSEVVAILTW